MALERRNGRIYYYRPRRVNGRIVRGYVGRGAAARMAAAADQLARERQARLKRSEDMAREKMQRLDSVIGRIAEQVETLLRGWMYQEGYHDRARQWRRDRTRQRATAAR
jgi:hypothetical protein